MVAKLKTFLIITLISTLPTILIWTPFFLKLESVWKIPLPKGGMSTIVANYDGPLFIVVAKTLYNPELVGNFEFPLPSTYYAAHFPLFPILIRLFSPLFGFPYSMLLITTVSSLLAAYFFYLFIQNYVDKKNALWVTTIFAIFPARWLIVRSVGSAEPLFLATIIASLYYFKQKKYILAGLFGALAQLTKAPAILLFISYLIALIYPKFKELSSHPATKLYETKEITKLLSVLLIPIALLSVFFLYRIQLGDFLAYFHSGDNIHLFFPPFQIFNYSQAWVGTFWLEEVLFVYLLGLVGLVKLIKLKDYDLTWFVGIFFASILFVSHRDIIRYALPIVPFLYAAFAKTITQKEFRYVILVLIIPIYLFSLAYISQNVMPISDWSPLL